MCPRPVGSVATVRGRETEVGEGNSDPDQIAAGEDPADPRPLPGLPRLERLGCVVGTHLREATRSEDLVGDACTLTAIGCEVGVSGPRKGGGRAARDREVGPVWRRPPWWTEVKVCVSRVSDSSRPPPGGVERARDSASLTRGDELPLCRACNRERGVPTQHHQTSFRHLCHLFRRYAVRHRESAD